jgi:hypothetical protein
MAVYYDLGAGFTSKATAEAFLKHFEVLEIPLSSGENLPTRCSMREAHGHWLVWVWPFELAIASPHGSRPELLEPEPYNEIQAFLYEELKKCPPFLYAAFGGEMEDFFFDEDIREGLVTEPDYHVHGLILTTVQWHASGALPNFVPFAKDYVWMPCRRAQ